MSLLDTASLVTTPNAYKTSKLYSIVPSDGTGDFTATRAGDTATRVASDGLIKINRTNVLLQSNNFGTTWTLLNASLTTSQTDPLGTNTATKLVDDTTNGQHYVNQSVTTLAAVYSFSIYVKAAEYSQFQLFHRTGVSTNFNLSTLTTTTNGSISGTIEEIGNGWYRCTSVALMTAAANTQRIIILDDTGASSFAGTGAKGILIWRTQLELGDIPTQYIDTTTTAVTSGGPLANVPRLDYFGGGCPKLLIEPARTNQALYSTMLDNAAWTTSAVGVSVTKNATTSPSGMQSAEKVVANNGATTHYIRQINFSVVNTSSYVASVFVKKAEWNTVRIFLSNYFSPNPSAVFNIDTLSVSAQNATGQIIPYPNGWYRLILYSNVAPITGVGAHFTIDIGNNGNVGVAGNGTNGLFLWGAQFEAGTFPTSLIQTFNATATRNAESYADTSASSLIGATEGTLFADFVATGFSSSGIALNVSNNTNQQYLQIVLNSSGQIQFDVLSTTQQALITKSGNSTNTRYKVACAYKQNDFVMYVNGVQIGTDNSGTIPTGLSRIDFDFGNASSFANCGLIINTAALWKTRLPNSDLATLTTI